MHYPPNPQVAGPGTLEGLAAAWEGKRDVAALLVVEMSCAGNLAVGRSSDKNQLQMGFPKKNYQRYSEACIALGKHRTVAGFIAQSPITKVGLKYFLCGTAIVPCCFFQDPGQLQLTPGVHLSDLEDGKRVLL